jgi:hypothetical protein
MSWDADTQPLKTVRSLTPAVLYLPVRFSALLQMLAHTWNQVGGGSVANQCVASASLSARDIVEGYSDGVRDTVAQSLNGTVNPVTNILRFVACDPVTGAYTNTTANAQQSCHSGTGYPAGDGYYNNYNNLMSYGDRYCLRTLTPGQGARARCAIK